MKRVFIIHGWDGYPEEAWFLWLKSKIEEKGWQAIVPQMPEADSPKIDLWLPFLSNLVLSPDKDTFFVGHSIGVQTILRYLETINAKIGGVLAVAGFFTLKPKAFEDNEDKATAEPWLTTPLNYEKIKNNLNKMTAIFSDNDPFVSLENVDYFKDRLGAKTIVEHQKGHMGGGDKIDEYPLIFEELLELLK